MSNEIKLDLGCGKNKRTGFTGVDIFSGADIQWDLTIFPWPWDDNSVDQIYCSHFIEHLPMGFIDGQDLFFKFFDECWRILKPERFMEVICPNARSNRAFQDPTHRRFIVSETFLYLSENFRKINGLDHYLVKCNFDISVSPIISNPELQLMNPEAASRRMNENWNVVQDWSAKLIKPKEM